MRETFRTVLDPRRPEAAAVLASLMDQAGYFSLNAETVKPELVAMVNWLLAEIGVIHPLNVYRFAQALLGIANDDDLAEAQRIANQGETDAR